MIDFLNHGDVRNEIQLKNIGDEDTTICNNTFSALFFAIEPSIRGIGLSSDLRSSSSLCTFKNELRQLYLSLSDSFQIYVVSMIIKLLSSGTEVTMQCS